MTTIGREAELARLDALIDEAQDGGGALVLVGPAGIGKSTLLEHAARRAQADGVRLLRTAGVEPEAHLPFAGLHQLLLPTLDHAGELPGPQQSALLGAFGMGDSTGPNVFMIGLAALGLLSVVADRKPVLLIVEDAHWLDLPSCEVLSFVGRRLEAEPVLMLAAVREGYDCPLVGRGLAEWPISGLDDDTARALLEQGFPDLDFRGA